MRHVLVVFAVTLTACIPGGDSSDGGPTPGGPDAGGRPMENPAIVTRDGGVAAYPAWTTLTAQVAGRTGRDLRIGLVATDRNLDVVSIFVRQLDGAGGVLAEGTVTLEGKRWTGESLTAAGWVRGVFASGSGPARVAVTLLDATGLQSDEREAEVAAQPVVARGASCDSSFLANRCEPGLGCRGMPPVCDEGLAPQITRMGFFRAPEGPTILIEGTEPEDDLASMRFTFQNAQGQPISIDSDGDQSPDLSSFEHPATALAVDGTYLLRLQSGQGLDTQVPKLVATPVDEAGHVGTAKIASPSTLPVRATGQTCDPKGFDVCGAGLSCSPGLVGATNRCASAAPMRDSQCSAAPVVTPTTAGAVAVGVAEGGSLWDAPAGCASADPKGRPEGVVVLRLVERADRLRLTTVSPRTTFDTTMYVMPGCPDDISGALGCSDDVPMGQGASELVLEGLPAGDYLVVIDSFDGLGGSFELHAFLE